MTLEIIAWRMLVSYKNFSLNFFFLAVEFFIDMLGPEEEGKISHVTEIEISERATGKRKVGGPDIPEEEQKEEPLIKIFKDPLGLNKPKKGKKGKKGGKKKKKK